MKPHLRHFMRTDRPATFSSAIWYFALQLGQRNFIQRSAVARIALVFGEAKDSAERRAWEPRARATAVPKVREQSLAWRQKGAPQKMRCLSVGPRGASRGLSPAVSWVARPCPARPFTKGSRDARGSTVWSPRRGQETALFPTFRRL